MKGTNRYIKALSMMLCLAMLLSYLPLSSLTAFAADDTTAANKTVMLGTSGISDPTATQDKKGTYYTPSDYVYFGVNGSDPIKWRVLDADKTNDGTTSGMFLLSEYLLASGVMFESAWNSDDNDGQTNPNEWQYSDAQSWCNNLVRDSFSSAEQASLLGVKKTDNAEKLYSISWSASSLTESDKVFFLSARELADYVGNYSGAQELIAYTDSTEQSTPTWWLRSSGNITVRAGAVNQHGDVSQENAHNTFAVRPAFNLNLNSVLFTSAAAGGKADGFNAVSDYSGTDWKLTLLDSSRSAFEATFSSISNNTVTVSYSGAKTGDNEYISAIIKNGSTVKYYGRLGLASESGTATVTLPDDFNAANGDVLCIFNEQYNGDYKTDYASELIEIGYKVTFDANGGTGTMNSVIAMGTYTLPANGFTAPLDYEFDAWSIGGEKKAIGDSITVSADTTVTAEWKLISPSYTVTIPATATPGEAFTVSAEATVLRSTQTLTVAITGTSGTDNAFTLKNAQNVELGYTLKNGETVIGLNDKLLALTNGQTGSVSIDIVPDQAKYSGDYTGTVIFTIALEEVVSE